MIKSLSVRVARCRRARDEHAASRIEQLGQRKADDPRAT